jgi:rare lipoprotein A
LNPSYGAALALAAVLCFLGLTADLSAETKGNTNSKSGAVLTTAAWTQAGQASFYSGRWHGGPTASGEVYDQNSLTAAHKTLPMNTLVEVTRPDTGAKVIVRINNRGPYVRGRVIDLSKEAAKRLNMVNMGVAKVSLRILPGKNTGALEEAMAVRDAAIAKEKNDYTLTLASFESKADAKRFRERMLAVKVEDAIVKRVRQQDGVKYRVEIDGFSSEDAARQKRDELSEKVLAK